MFPIIILAIFTAVASQSDYDGKNILVPKHENKGFWVVPANKDR